MRTADLGRPMSTPVPVFVVHNQPPSDAAKASKAQEKKDRELAEAAKAARATYEGALANIVRQADSSLQESAKASNGVTRQKIDLLVREGDADSKAVRAKQEIHARSSDVA